LVAGGGALVYELVVVVDETVTSAEELADVTEVDVGDEDGPESFDFHFCGFGPRLLGLGIGVVDVEEEDVVELEVD